MTAACRACGGPTRPWARAPAAEPGDSGEFELARCERCGSATTLGPAPGRDAYETGAYAPGEPRASGLVRAYQRSTVGQPVRLLGRAGAAPPARVLDAGAGAGRLVAALRAAGYDAHGIEPSARSQARAAAAGLPVARRAIEEHSDRGLDAAVLWHVVEHLEQPGTALARVHDWLAPGGLVLVAVPNVASWQARGAGPGWVHLDLPRHRVHFTPAGLRAVLLGAGFAPVAAHHLLWDWGPAGMWMAALTRLGMRPGLPFHLLKRNARLRPRDAALLALGVALAPVAVAAELVAAGARRGGTIAIVAQAA